MKEVKIKNIKKGKLKFFFTASGAIGFLITGIKLTFSSSSDNYFVLKLIIGILSIVFWSGLLIWAIRRFINKLQYGLIINSKGIMNNSDEIENTFVPWTAIGRIELLSGNKKNKIGIFIKELSNYESLIKSKFERNQIKKNIKVFGAPIIISPDTMNKESKEILELMMSYWKRVS